MPYTIISTSGPTDADRRIILESLVAFNDVAGGPSGYEPVAVLIRNGEDETIGGLWGKLSYDWLLVELLFIPDELRGAGLGAKLMSAAEGIARDRNCVGVWLDTHGFQAPGFYEALGYERFGELPDHPRGTSRLFFRKVLAFQA